MAPAECLTVFRSAAPMKGNRHGNTSVHLFPVVGVNRPPYDFRRDSLWQNDRDAMAYVKTGTGHPYQATISYINNVFRQRVSLGRIAALFGPWGSGKTTLLDALREQALQGNKELKSETGRRIEFGYVDAWDHQYSSDVLLTAFASLVQPTVDVDKPWYTAFATENSVQSFTRGVMTVAGAGLGAASRWIGIGGSKELAADIEASRAAVGDRMVEYCRQHHEQRVAESHRSMILDSLASQAFSLRNLQAGRDRIVFVIDNLDRCNPSILLDVLESLEKTKGLNQGNGFHNIHFLFPLDRNALCKAIQSRYTTFSTEDQLSYAEKVFSPTFYMPTLDSPTLEQILIAEESCKDFQQAIADMGGLPAIKLGDVSNVAVRLLRGNPRRAIRLVHAAEHHLSRLPSNYRTIAKELHANVLLSAIALATFFPKFAELLAARTSDVLLCVGGDPNPNIADCVAKANLAQRAISELSNELQENEDLFEVFRMATDGFKEASDRNYSLKGLCEIVQGTLNPNPTVKLR